MTSKNNSVSEAEKLPSDEQLRRSLAHIISTLGASRWKFDVDAQGAVYEVSEDQGERPAESAPAAGGSEAV